jgi:hypothetical protein
MELSINLASTVTALRGTLSIAIIPSGKMPQENADVHGIQVAWIKMKIARGF